MAQATPTFYVFHGDDLFAIEEEVARMRQRMGEDSADAALNIITFEGRTAEVADVFNAASALPFFADKRLVIVTGWLGWLGRSGAGKAGQETLGRIVEQLPRLPDWARLVFVEKEPLPEDNPVLRLARSEPRGYIRTFRLPQNPARWIVQRAEHYGAAIEPGAVQALALLFSDNLVAADNELFKLAAYVGEGRPISEADVAALTPYVPEESVFEMVDALGRRDGRTATRVLHRLLEKGDPLALLGMVVRQFRLLIQAREHLERGAGRGTAMGRALGVHRFVAEKLEVQSRNFSLEDLEHIYHTLLDLDRRIKTGEIEAELALDVLIAGLSA